MTRRGIRSGGIGIALALVVSTLVVIGGATPAFACTCNRITSPRAWVSSVDVVFEGHRVNAVEFDNPDRRNLDGYPQSSR